MIKVDNIADVAGCDDVLVDLLMTTWPAYYGAGGVGDAAQTIAQRRQHRSGGVASLYGQLVGTVALSETSFGARSGDEGFWLIGLCVTPAARQMGAGTALVRWAMAQADAPLFTTTQYAAGLLRRLGWTDMREVTDDSGRWSVLKAPPKTGEA